MALIGLMYALYSGSTIIITFIKGFMVGVLYHNEELEDVKINEHTLQFCLMILTITILWETERIEE
jgi:hypothetical protein